MSARQYQPDLPAIVHCKAVDARIREIASAQRLQSFGSGRHGDLRVGVSRPPLSRTSYAGTEHCHREPCRDSQHLCEFASTHLRAFNYASGQQARSQPSANQIFKNKPFELNYIPNPLFARFFSICNTLHKSALLLPIWRICCCPAAGYPVLAPCTFHYPKRSSRGIIPPRLTAEYALIPSSANSPPRNQNGYRRLPRHVSRFAFLHAPALLGRHQRHDRDAREILGAAVKQSWIRFAATAVGAAVTRPVYGIRQTETCWSSVWPVFVTIVLCTILHLADGIRLAAVTIAIIMLVPNTGRPWVPALNRFLEVSFWNSHRSGGSRSSCCLPPPSKSLRHALAEKFLQLDTFLSALLLRFRGENVVDALKRLARGALETLGRQNTDFYAHGRYEPARWSARRITLVKLLQHEERPCLKRWKLP